MRQIKNILIAIIVLASFSFAGKAQTNVDSVNLQLRALFGNLAKPVPPKLFNWDMALHTIDSSYFVEENYADTLDLDNFYNMYNEMRYSAYDTLPYITADSLLNRTQDYGPDTVNMLTMYFDYYKFKPDALTTDTYFNFDTINDILTDKTVRPGFPYDEYTVFASCPNKNVAARSQVVFRFGLDNTMYDSFNDLGNNNAGRTIYSNFNDGTGWHMVVPNQDNYFVINFDTAKVYKIETMVTIPVGELFDTIAYSMSYLKIKKVRAGILDEPNQTFVWSDLYINQYDPCTPINCDTKTLIYVEGFDVMDFTVNGNTDAQAIYEDRITGSDLSDLRNFNYRIFVIDWKNSRIDMRDNAKNLCDFIEYLKCGYGELPDCNKEEYVIMGESMGGIIANYALLMFESGQYHSSCKRDQMHNTRLLITLDSPFEGAHIPMSIQKFSEYVATHFTGAGNVPFLPIANKLLMQGFNMLNDGYAAKQLMMYHVSTQSPVAPYTF